jgi:hypothetical protein
VFFQVRFNEPQYPISKNENGFWVWEEAGFIGGPFAFFESALEDYIGFMEASQSDEEK